MRKLEDFKFRAYHKIEKRMFDIYQLGKDCIIEDTSGTGHIHGLKIYDGVYLEDIVIMQYTGIKDKNRKEIYEGDIFEVDGKYQKVVRYDPSRVAFSVANIANLGDEDQMGIWEVPNSEWWLGFEESIEMIGNIHQNKDLI